MNVTSWISKEADSEKRVPESCSLRRGFGKNIMGKRNGSRTERKEREPSAGPS